jgi:uncharacterized protein DUF5985
MSTLKDMLVGAIMVSAWAISVFFFRFWRKTRDRLFGFFSAAFLLLGLERISILMVSGELHGLVYLLRFCAFLLIIFAIVEKNRSGSGKF